MMTSCQALIEPLAVTERASSTGSSSTVVTVRAASRPTLETASAGAAPRSAAGTLSSINIAATAAMPTSAAAIEKRARQEVEPTWRFTESSLIIIRSLICYQEADNWQRAHGQEFSSISVARLARLGQARGRGRLPAQIPTTQLQSIRRRGAAPPRRRPLVRALRRAFRAQLRAWDHERPARPTCARLGADDERGAPPPRGRRARRAPAASRKPPRRQLAGHGRRPGVTRAGAGLRSVR